LFLLQLKNLIIIAPIVENQAIEKNFMLFQFY